MERRASAAFSAVQANGFPVRFVEDGYRVEIADAVLEGGVLRLLGVKAWRNGVAVPVDPDLAWVNPPVLVSDPEGDVVQVGEDGPLRFREDPGAVIVRDLLEIVAKADR